MMKIEKLDAGRDMDALVSEKVLGHAVCRCKISNDTGPDGTCESCEKPRGKFYSTHPEKALGLLEILARDQQITYRIERTADSRGGACFEVTITGGKTSPACGTGPTVAVAICRAAILAVEG